MLQGLGRKKLNRFVECSRGLGEASRTLYRKLQLGVAWSLCSTLDTLLKLNQCVEGAVRRCGSLGASAPDPLHLPAPTLLHRDTPAASMDSARTSENGWQPITQLSPGERAIVNRAKKEHAETTQAAKRALLVGQLAALLALRTSNRGGGRAGASVADGVHTCTLAAKEDSARRAGLNTLLAAPFAIHRRWLRRRRRWHDRRWWRCTARARRWTRWRPASLR